MDIYTVCCSVLQCNVVCCTVLRCVAVCCSALQCVAVCCIYKTHIYMPIAQGVGGAAVGMQHLLVLQCVAVCCSVVYE